MSLDPNDLAGPLSEWSISPAHPRHRRAAIWLWSVGAVQILAFGCCATLFLVLASSPWPDLEKQMAQQQVPADQIEMVRQIHPDAVSIAILPLVVGVVPAMGYVLLAFGVRAAKRWACHLSLIIAFGQAVVVGLVLVLAIIGDVQGGTPGAAVFQLALAGGALVILIILIRSLLGALSAPRVSDDAVEPWDAPPP